MHTRKHLRDCLVAASAMRAHRPLRPLSSEGSDAVLPFFRGSLWKPVPRHVHQNPFSNRPIGMRRNWAQWAGSFAGRAKALGRRAHKSHADTTLCPTFAPRTLEVRSQSSGRRECAPSSVAFSTSQSERLALRPPQPTASSRRGPAHGTCAEDVMRPRVKTYAFLAPSNAGSAEAYIEPEHKR